MSRADEIFMGGEHAAKLRDYAKELEAERDKAVKDSWAQGSRADEAEGQRDSAQARVRELEAEVAMLRREGEREWRTGMPTEADKAPGSDAFLVCFESSECEVVVQTLNLYREGFYDDGDDHIPEGSVIGWMPVPKPPVKP